MITNLKPGVNFSLIFKYTHLQDGVVKEETIDTQYTTTLIPNITLVGTKVTSKKISYKIGIFSYGIDSAKLRLYINGERQNKELAINSNNLNGDFNISGISFPNNALIELRLEDIFVGYWFDDETYINGLKINKNYSWSYRTANIVDPEPEPENPSPDNPEEPPVEPNEPEVEEPTPDTPTPEPTPDSPENEGGVNNE